MATMTSARIARSGRPASVRERRPGWVMLSVALIVGLAVVAGYLYQQAGHKSAIVVMADSVPVGHAISRADLSTVSVAGPLTSIPGADLDRVVGLRASVTLLAGTPVQRSMLSTAGDLQPGQAQVGLALSSGQAPADGVQAGDEVEILRLPDADTASTKGTDEAAQVLVAQAQVWSTRPDPSRTGGLLLTVTVPADVVSDVVSASGAGQVAVARVLG